MIKKFENPINDSHLCAGLPWRLASTISSSIVNEGRILVGRPRRYDILERVHRDV